MDKEKMKLCLLILLCHGSLAVKHSMKYFVTGSSGLLNIPELAGVVMVDGIQMGYCDVNKKILEPRQDWAKTFLEKHPEQVEWYNHECFEDQPNKFRELISSLKQQLNQSEGVHILQKIDGCEWDETTEGIIGMIQYGYNGEGFLEFDLKKLTWIALKPEADITKQKWDADHRRIKHTKNDLTNICPEHLKMYLNSGKSFLHRTVPPSVSLLQKTPSSPVSCHATGFCPDRAVMFWTKDGEEIHEGVDPGEILPNNDGTFQLSVDLNVSSVTPEDWQRYDCVFTLSGGDDIITNLNDRVIRTNWKEKPMMMIPIIAVAVAAAVFIFIGFVVYKKMRGTRTEQTTGNIEVSRLKPEPEQHALETQPTSDKLIVSQ